MKEFQIGFFSNPPRGNPDWIYGAFVMGKDSSDALKRSRKLYPEYKSRRII